MKYSAERPSISHLLLVLLLLFAYFAALSQFRLVDEDEGYYVFAAKIVMEGRIPYLDFFYPQMPLTSYLYGTWMKIFGFNWNSARLLSALLSALLGMLLYACILQFYPKRSYALLAVCLYLFSSFVMAWMTVVKTYALSTVLLFLAFYFYSTGTPEGEKSRSFFIGLLLALAVNTRLFFLPLFIPFSAIILVSKHTWPNRLRAITFFVLGGASGMLMNVPFLVGSPDKFLFNNVGFHALRSEYGFIGGFDQKLVVILQLFHESYQFILLFVTALAGYLLLNRNNPFSLGIQISLWLFLLNLLPSPSFEQYFCTLVPFLITGCIPTIQYLQEKFRNRTHLQTCNVVLATLLLGYVFVFMVDARRFLQSGQNVPGVEHASLAFDWKLSTIQRVSQEIEKYSMPGVSCFSIWPGYFVETGIHVLPGTENHFGIFIAEKLSQDQRDKYRIISYRDTDRYLREHHAKVVIIGNGLNPGFRKKNQKFLLAQGYKWVKEIGNTDIYTYGF